MALGQYNNSISATRRTIRKREAQILLSQQIHLHLQFPLMQKRFEILLDNMNSNIFRGTYPQVNHYQCSRRCRGLLGNPHLGQMFTMIMTQETFYGINKILMADSTPRATSDLLLSKALLLQALRIHAYRLST